MASPVAEAPAASTAAAAKKFVTPAGTPAAFEPYLRAGITLPDGFLGLAVGEHALANIRDPTELGRVLGWTTPENTPAWASDPAGADGFLDALLKRGDPLADALVAELGPAAHTRVVVPELDKDSGVEAAGDDAAPTPAPAVGSAKAEAAPPLTAEFLAERLGLKQLPAWADEAQILRGQQLYWKYTFMIAMILLHASLAGAFGTPRIDAILMYTGYITGYSKRTAKRLLETTDWVLNSLIPGELTKVGGTGFMHTIKVRLMHAGVRARIAKSLEADPATYSDRTKAVKDHEAPLPGVVHINQADMLSTLLSFQSVVLVGLLKLGAKLTWQEMVDYTASWRLIGHILGLDDDANPCQWTVETSIYLTALFMKKYNTIYSEGNAPTTAPAAISLPEGHPPVPAGSAASASAAAAAAGCPFAAGAEASDKTGGVLSPAATAEGEELDAAARVMASDITLNLLKSTTKYLDRLPLVLHRYYFHLLMGPTIAARLHVPEVHGFPVAVAKMLAGPIAIEADFVGKSGDAGADGKPARWVAPRMRLVRKLVQRYRKRLDRITTKASS
ncbi:hypothetical protein HK405_005267 [Cladochytrium tenue]|nr:hypothetical protein HK405_005267 [Cladochytrium tenue]